MAIIETSASVAPPAFLAPSTSLATPTPDTQRELLPASKGTSFMWILFGFAAALLGAWLAGIETAERVANSNDDYAGLAYLFYVPLGWVAGNIAATLVAWGADRNRVRAGASRRLLVAVGPLTPVALIVVGLVLLVTLG